MRSALLVQLARQDRAELAGEGLQPSGVAPEVVRQLVVADHRRNRGDQAERGGEQRLGDARRHHRKAGVLRRGDRGEGVHDAPYRAEQARSEEHTSELQSLMRLSYAVFCLKTKNTNTK